MLELGMMTDVTTVTGETPLVASENATIPYAIDNTKNIELPLNGRNSLEPAGTAPRVVSSINRVRFGKHKVYPRSRLTTATSSGHPPAGRSLRTERFSSATTKRR